MAKRLATELQNVSKSYDVETINDNLFKWNVAIPGPDSTPFFGYTFLIEIIFPQTYPFDKPTVTFKTNMYHPNISSKGEICLGILSDWKSKNTVIDILTFITNLLSIPDPNDPLDAKIAKEYLLDKNTYEKKARECAQRHAV